MADAKKKDNPFKKKGKEKRKLNISDEERERRSKAAKERHAKGELGGAEYGKLGGRPRSKRASEVVAEAAEKNGQLIAEVFLDAMDDENPNSIRLKGAEGILKVEQTESRLKLAEEEHDAKMGRDEIEQQLAGMFANNPMLAALFQNAARKNTDQNVIEGTGEEVVEAEVVDDH